MSAVTYSSSGCFGNLPPVDKLCRKALADQQKRIKPEYLKTIINPEVLESAFGDQILSYLQTMGVAAEARSQNVYGTISWQRSLEQTITERLGDLALNDTIQEEDSVLIVWQAVHFIDVVLKDKLIEEFRDIKIKLPGKRITLLVCGLKEYIRINGDSVAAFEPIKLEIHLTKLQLLANINHRLLDTSADLANTVMQFTKSVAEAPFKQQTAEKNQHFFATNDNKDCVAVKGTAGLSNLWQHHLIKLPMVTLEIAEAIISEYPMPRLLLNAYEKTTNGQDLLANIPVRRAGGVLTSVRKVGPELSAKIHALYTRDDPNYVL